MREREWGVTDNDYGALCLNDENVLELATDDDCRTLRIY